MVRKLENHRTVLFQVCALTEDAVAVLNAADEVHAVDLAGLGALLDDHRQAAVHAVLACQQVTELLGSASVNIEMHIMKCILINITFATTECKRISC